MLISSHVAAGFLVSSRLRSPAAAFATGVASHLLMDALPHWGTTDTVRFLQVARADGVAGLVLLALLLRARPDRVPAAGMFGAVLPDLEKPVIHLLGSRLFPPDVAAFLSDIQTEAPDALGRELVVAVALAAGALAVGYGSTPGRGGRGSFRRQNGISSTGSGVGSGLRRPGRRRAV